MEAVDTLICARWIIPIEPAGQVLEHCAVAIRQGRIHAIVPQAAARSRFTAREILERNAHVLVPGFINAHVPMPLALLRGNGVSTDLHGPEARWVDEEFVRLGTELALAETIMGGTTCTLDSFLYPDIRARAAAEAHVRTCIGLPLFERPNLWAGSADEAMRKGLEVHDEYRDHPLITTAFAPVSAMLGEATLERVGRLANELDMPIAVPLNQTKGDDEAKQERSLQRFERLGLLSPLTIAAHMIHLTDADLALAQRAGINVVHCPQANLRQGFGLAPIVDLQAYGLNIACGTDNPSFNGDLDMLDEIRTAALLAQKPAGEANDAPDAHEWLRMATLNGAQALGLSDACGSIEVGKWADLCCIDFDSPATRPVYDPAATLVYAASRAQVSDVWVAGRALLAAGRLTGFDVPALLSRVESWRTTFSLQGSSLTGLPGQD